MGLLDGLVVLVTGATSGIGAATAIQAAKEGARGVVVSGRREAKGREVVEAITALGGHAIFVQCDVRVEDQVRALIEETVTQYGRLDCAFNNAGVVSDPTADAWDTEAFDQLIHTNTTSILMCMKYEVRQMSAQEPTGGSIVNCGSIAGLVTATRFTGGYGASKAAISALTRSVAAAYISKGVRVNAVLPGATESEIWGPNGRERMQRIGERAPIGRHAEADEVAKPAVFLLSNYSSYIVGQSVVVDGGLTIAFS